MPHHTVDRALEVALTLSNEANVFSRGKWGLLGIWGDLIERWLEEMLPEEAAARCAGRVVLAAGAVPRVDRPWFEAELLTRFDSRRDLIEANLASIHVPLFLDYKLTARFRGAHYVDGSLVGGEWLLAPTGAPECIHLSHSADPRMRAK